MAGNKTKSVIAPDSGIELYGYKDYDERLKKLEKAALDATRGANGITAPLLDCTPVDEDDDCLLCACAIASQRGVKDGGNRGILPTIKYLIPTNTTTLVTSIIKSADWDSEDESKHNNIIKGKLSDDEITDDDRATGHLLGEFSGLLEEETDYYIIQLKAKADGESFAQTPPGDLVPGDGVDPGQFLAKFATKKIIPANPSDPSCDDLVRNEPNLADEVSGNAIVEFVIQADKDHVISVEELDIDKAIIWLLPLPADYPAHDLDPTAKAEQINVEISRDNLIDPDDDPLAFAHFGIKITGSLPIGRHYLWYRTVLKNAAGKAKTEVDFDEDGAIIVDPDKSCAFFAGGKVAASDDEIPEPTITVVNNLDSRNTEVTVSYTQLTQPVLLQNTEIFISYDGGSSDHIVGSVDLRLEEPNTAGTHTVVVPIRHHKDREQATWTLQPRITGVGKFFDISESRVKHPRKDGDLVDFVPFYGQPTGYPSFAVVGDLTSTINTDTEASDAFVLAAVRCYAAHPTDETPMDGRDGGHSPAAPLSFKEAHVGEVIAILSNDPLDGTEKHKLHHVITSNAERDAFSLVCSAVLAGLSDKVYWTKTRFTNGDGSVLTKFPTAIAINLGGVVRAIDDAHVPVPSITSITQQGNRHAILLAAFTQTTPATLLARMKVEISRDGGATWSKKEPYTLRNNEDYHAPGGVYSIPILVSHPASSTVIYRIRLVAAGGFQSAWITSSGVVTPGDSNIPPATSPSAPGSGLVIENVLDSADTQNGMARVKLRVQTANGLSFATNHISVVQSLLKLFGESTEKVWLGGQISDTSATQVDFMTYIPTGVRVDWVKNVFGNGDQQTTTSTTYSFYAGANYARALADADVPVTSNVFSTIDNKHGLLTVSFTQVAILAILLKKIVVQISLDAGSTWTDLPSINVKGIEFTAPGTAYSFPINVAIPANQANLRFRTRLVAIGDFKSAFTVTSATTAADFVGSLLPTTTPTSPSVGTVIENVLDAADTQNGLARIRVRITTSNGLSFGSQNITQVFAVFRKFGDATERLWFGGAVIDSTVSFMDVEFFAPTGIRLDWLKNVFVNGDKSTQSTGTYTFYAGATYARATADADVPVTANVFTTIDNKHGLLTVTFTQVAVLALLLKKLVVQISLNGGSTYTDLPSINVKGIEYSAPGTLYTFPINVDIPANQANVRFRTRLVAIGDFKSAFTVTSATTAADFVGAVVPSVTPANPVIGDVTLNTVDAEPTSGNARIRIKSTLSSGTFGSQNVKEVWFRIKRTAESVKKIWVGGSVDPADSVAEFEFIQTIGTPLTILQCEYVNGDKATVSSTVSVAFTAGLLTILPGDPTTVTSPVFVSITNRNSKKDTVIIRAQQPTSGTMIAFKELLVEQDDGNGFEELERINLVTLENLYSGLNNDGVHGFKDVKKVYRRSAGTGVTYRASQISVGGKASSVTTITNGSTTAEITPDTTSPTGQSTPVLSYNTHGGLIVKNMFSTTAIHTLKERYVVVRDAFGHYYNFETNVLAVSEAAARLKIGLVDRYHFKHAKLYQLRQAFDAVTTPPYNLFAYFYDENDINVSSVSPDSNALTITDVTDVFDSRDSISVVDNTVFGTNLYQLVNNGDFLYYAGGVASPTITVGGGWRRWDGTGSVSSAIKITTGTTGITWNKPNHNIVWTSNTLRFLYNMEQRLLPGDYITIRTYVKSGASISPAVSCKLIADDGSNTDDTESFPNPTLSLTASGYAIAEWVLRLKLTADATVDHWIVFQTPFSLNSTNDIELDRMMVVRGRTGMAFGPRLYFELNGQAAAAGTNLQSMMAGAMVGTENPDSTPNSITQPDLGNPTGRPKPGGDTPGGGWGSGFGGMVPA
jgi:hypothetical protein